ncbi:GTPase-activating protein GYP5 [Aaosphaeria arxii CBS 175.79]|uniref:GTPase-activating protein GYP5 n=1 Tax=Aaosphaeria arxii CBS 175.79 TaxID=1450172 RepID=A0A6A5XXW5_9PLEO|nr:GTPase-activating protein GYP5 [Aaosphaeria arxii CBS 175.79]KAF2017114.1 GTPase-activating protein GYP5 [Aaosphaeria arxii CBS 175.79]
MAEQQPVRPASRSSSPDRGETFEDATTGITPRPNSQSGSRSRSLLSRRTSSSSTMTKDTAPDSPIPDMPENAAAALAAEKDKGKGIESLDGAEDQPAPEKSPLLTAHRISVTSDMDDVSLEEEDNKSPGLLPKLPPRENSTSGSGLQGLSGKMSPVKFPPPPPPPAAQEKHTSLPPPPAPTRKLTSPFSWLSRNSSSKKPESPPLATTTRRNTNASIATVGSNPELMLSKIDDEGDQSSNNRSSQTSLRDRFKLLRMREEAGITLNEEGAAEVGQPGGALAGLLGRTTSIGLGVGSPGGILDDKDEHGHGTASGPTSPRPGSLGKQSTINPSLAPGTASGIAVGPAEDAEPVDWDLWQSVVNEGPAAVARTSSEELNRAIASGIPQAIRGVIWQVLAQSKSEELEQTYKELVVRGTDKEHTIARSPLLPNGQSNSNGKEKDSIASSSSSVHSDYSTPATTNGSNAPLASPSITTDSTEDLVKLQAKPTEQKKTTKDDAAAIQKLEKVIKRDLGARTSYSKYLMAAGLQDGLFGICKAYALYDESVGYAQGMNFIAMPLLFNMPEEEAFSLFVTLMNKYHLRDLFIQDMPGLHLHLYQFERLLEDFEPALYCHLRRREVKPQLYATQWFLTLFAYRFPLQLVLRIYDLILSEGLEGAILKFGLVLMQKNAETLLGMKDMATLTTFLKERLFDVYIDKAPSASSILESGFFGSAGGVDKEVYRADMLVRDAVSVKITSDMLKQYTAEWKEQQRAEKERETELHGLKEKTATLEVKVRQLERRAEQSDTEHVQVASELVKTKVENENLADENETLKTKVEELQKIVDTQPAEVEAKMKQDIDSIMEKNLVVHNENRALEEQLAEMEKELVATKMQWATINEEYETLKQKWNNITQMMNR